MDISLLPETYKPPPKNKEENKAKKSFETKDKNDMG